MLSTVVDLTSADATSIALQVNATVTNQAGVDVPASQPIAQSGDAC